MAAPTTLKEALATFEPVIGLEVHAQLKTRTKIFSSAPTGYEPEHPNKFVTPYCFGLPGVLPVLNRRAVELAIRAGLALGCEIRRRSIWARKHYFYPDLPKGYQLSQYEEPICEHGGLEIEVEGSAPRRIGITRIHMEEDAGKSMHVEGAPYSLVDYNRAGFPLIEIVSEPDLRSAQEASAYLKALRSILMAIDVNDGNLEEGSFRCDANVSIRPRGETKLGTRCELKNINSFKFVEQAIEFEILRHARILAQGGAIEQETRLYDSAKRETRSMRSKEEAHDYRYFPDPDLPPLDVSDAWIDEIRSTLPELPAAKRARWVGLGVPEEHALAFAEESEVAAFFDAAVRAFPEGAVPIAHMVKGDVLRELKEETLALAALRPEDVAELVRLKEAKKISSTQQRKMLLEVWSKKTPLADLLAREGSQIEDPSVLEPIIAEVVAKSPKEAAKLREGQDKLLAFFVGQVMKATGGKAKPELVRDLILKKVREGA